MTAAAKQKKLIGGQIMMMINFSMPIFTKVS
jgi:hypothetical protein